MSKAKTASKNNPITREQAREYFFNGKKIRPVKLISEKRSYFAAEYEDSGELVVDQSGVALPWSNIRN